MARAVRSSLGEVAWEYAAERSAYLGGSPEYSGGPASLAARSLATGAPGGRSPAEDEQGDADDCQRLAAAVAEWLAEGD